MDELVSERWLRNPDLAAPVILAGDFNATADSWTAHRIGEILHDVSVLDVDARTAGEDVPRTYSGRIPMLRIDHVFASDDVSVRRVHVPRTRLTRAASDHLPLVVDLQLPEPV